MKHVLAKIKGWKGGEFAPAGSDMEFLQNINLEWTMYHTVCYAQILSLVNCALSLLCIVI